ncbi:MAG: hypothetical protein M3O88_05495 [Actinomycetota bacterium]|nr:hypothetical protein [Actinomycetota bacterium]
MRVEFFRPNAPDEVVGRARWDGRRVVIEAEDDTIKQHLAGVFRLTPVVVDDASMRSLGSHGTSVLQPGSLEWFRAAALTRAGRVGLAARMVPEFAPGTGWDPAADYRTFRNEIRRLDAAEATADLGGPD